MSGSLSFSHRYVPGASGRTLLLLHGTGGNENDLLSLGRALDPDAALLSPRGKVSENGMPRFFRRLAEGVFDEEDLIHRTHELAEFVQEASEFYRFSAANVDAVGYSNGANIAGALLLLRPGIVRAAALLRPMLPIVPDPLPELGRARVFIAAGNHDPIVPAENTGELVTLLERCGADVTVFRENAGHGLTNETLARTREWLLEG